MSAPASRAARLTPSEQVALARLTHAADLGELCPSNDDLSEALGHASPATGSAIIASLEAKRVIVVRRFPRARQVTIVASGRSTAEPVDRSVTGAAAGQLADAMAAGASSLPAAARQLGLSSERARWLWRAIRGRLGPQAS